MTITYDNERHEIIQSTSSRRRVIRTCDEMREYMHDNRAIKRCHELIVHECERVDANTMPPSFDRTFRYYRVVYQFVHIDENDEHVHIHRDLMNVNNRRSLRDAPIHVLFPK